MPPTTRRSQAAERERTQAERDEQVRAAQRALDEQLAEARRQREEERQWLEAPDEEEEEDEDFTGSEEASEEEAAGEDEDEAMNVDAEPAPATNHTTLSASPPSPTPSKPPFSPHNLKEISSLASWSVSTSKPTCGIAALRSPSTSLFWQSDGPQPHTLSIHFFKLVSIVAIRVYLDFEQDESYTPTKMVFLAGSSEHDLLEFAELSVEQPRGWCEVDMSGVGYDSDDEEEEEGDEGDGEAGQRERRGVLRAFLVQVKILENHQNGKDTHLRGLQIYARDKEGGGRGRREKVEDDVVEGEEVETKAKKGRTGGHHMGLKAPAWERELELR